MCNGHSSRISQGGSIAVLRPFQPQRTNSEDEMRLLFSNQADVALERAGTQVELHGWEANETLSQDRCWVIIHRDGDLTASSAHPLPPSAPFFSFALEDQSASIMQLQQRLDLGVGDAGIIGRRISVMTSSRKGPMTVAEGIIGWN